MQTQPLATARARLQANHIERETVLLLRLLPRPELRGDAHTYETLGHLAIVDRLSPATLSEPSG
jgi:hypothetical protein